MPEATAGDKTLTLRVLMDAVVPADGFPSASQAGGVRFLESVIRRERPDWAANLSRLLELVDILGSAPFVDLNDARRSALLDGLKDDLDYCWFARLVQMAYYADPVDGANENGVSWSMLGWNPAPTGGWPGLPIEDPSYPLVDLEGVRPRYDAVVIGSGAGGSVAAAELAESGRSVLLVESGDHPPTSELAHDHLRNARTASGLDARTMWASPANPRTVGDERGVVLPSESRWGGNAHTVGGGTRVYGAQAWRFVPADFRMASTYGVPDGSSLADWPIGYDDLEPYYSEAEWLLGVAGSDSDDARLVRRSAAYPMPALPMTAPGRRLADGAAAIGLTTTRVPLAINSRPFHQRPGCAACSQCVGFTCPIGAKNDADNTFVRRSVATGNVQLLRRARATRLLCDSRGMVTRVVLAQAGRSAEVGVAEVALGAGAIESARLLLLSANDEEPDGLGNRHDQVGRHLQGHIYAGALGVFTEPVNDFRGPGPVLSTHDFRHHNEGLVGEGMIANEFTPTPSDTYAYLLDAGLVERHGPGSKATMRSLMPRMQRVVGPVHEVTSAESRVRLDPHVTDALGLPVAHLTGGLHANDIAVQQMLSRRAAEWLRASGAAQVVPASTPSRLRPSSGQHQAGTCRMGTDPVSSVTDPFGRVWGHPNLRVVDASTHVTNGGVNPVLTVFANGLRILDAWVTGAT